MRDSGARVEGPTPSGPQDPAAPAETWQVALGRDAAVVLVFGDDARAESVVRHAREAGHAAMVRKGRVVLGYNGNSSHGASVLEDCLRATGGSDGPKRGELAHEVTRVHARLQARVAAYRDRQFHTPTEIGRELRRLSGYDRYRLYYLGPRYSGMPLDAVTSKLQPPAYQRSYEPPAEVPPPSSPTFSFIYGTCEPPSPGPEGGCAAPVQVQNYEICARNPHSFGVSPRGLTRRVRSVPVLLNEGAGAFEIYTGGTTVVIFAADWRAAARTAEQLRSVDGRSAPRSKLPAPVKGGLEGRLRCPPAPDSG